MPPFVVVFVTTGGRRGCGGGGGGAPVSARAPSTGGGPRAAGAPPARLHRRIRAGRHNGRGGCLRGLCVPVVGGQFAVAAGGEGGGCREGRAGGAGGA
eukprot:9489793-Pyramimonas_sp.AAC.1